MLSIQTNVNSMNAQENLRVTNQFQGRTIARLTSGFRINESGDDAAGLAVANKFRSDVTELMQGVRNANDGLSTMQIIDGGLNNISKILDRLKTLATQSASSTFTGNRATLNQEYSSLLSEIDRQASNIGLGAGDTNATRNSTDIKVFIGGGSKTANSQVSVDLTGKTVNGAGLGLTGTDVNGLVSKASVGTFGAGPFLAGSGTQTFSFATKTGTTQIQVNGGTAGLSKDEVIQKVNEGLAGTGIAVSLSSDGTKMEAASINSFAFAVEAKVGAGTDILGGAVASSTSTANQGKYLAHLGALTGTLSGGAHTMTVTPAGQGAVTINFADGSGDAAENAMRTALNGQPIDVVRIGDNVYLQSDTDFSVQASAIGATMAFAGGAGTILAAAATSYSADNPTAASDPTANSLAALTAISAAVTTLGNVQGKIGTAQNRLSYAIQLAQSQITSFSAAESRIRDADVASEAANLTKAQVLQQASLAALAQANSAPQAVLSLLRG